MNISLDEIHDTIPVVASTVRFKDNGITGDTVASVQSSTDQDPASSDEESKPDVFPQGILIPKHILPWGGRTAHKTKEKWKRRLDSEFIDGIS